VRRSEIDPEKLVARAGVGMLTILGIVLTAGYPYVHFSARRAEADRARIHTSLLDVRLGQLDATGGSRFELIIPGDSQWRRIAAQKRPPAFLIVAIGNWRSVTPLTRIGVSIRVFRNGSEVSLMPTSDTPTSYSADLADSALKFSASSGDHIRVDARLDASSVPESTMLRLLPSWSALREDDEVGIADLFSHTVAAGAGIAGLMCLLAAAALGWGRPAS
jgi:hypothetical protein